MKTRNEKVKLAMQEAAQDGYQKGFTTGGRYALALMLGIPRPSRVILDDELKLGEVAILANPGTDLQRTRIEKLGEFLDAIHKQDIATVAFRDMEVSPDLRLEQIVKACDEEANSPAGSSLEEEEELMRFVNRIRALARGAR